MCSLNAFTSMRSNSQVDFCAYGFCRRSSSWSMWRFPRYIPWRWRNASVSFRGAIFCGAARFSRAAGTTLSLVTAYSSGGPLVFWRNSVRGSVVTRRGMFPHPHAAEDDKLLCSTATSLAGRSGPYVMSEMIPPQWGSLTCCRLN